MTVAVAGVAESDLGAVAPGTTPLDLMGQASAGALSAYTPPFWTPSPSSSRAASAC